MTNRYKTFANFETLTADELNDYFMRQSLIEVDNEAGRDAIPSPRAGMRVYRNDRGWIEQYTLAWTGGPTAAGWYPIAGYMPFSVWNMSGSIATNTSDVLVAVARAESHVNENFLWNNGVITLPLAGRYRISLFGSWASSNTGSRGFWVRRNGTTETVIGDWRQSAGSTEVAISGVKRLAANDTLRVLCWQSSGGTLAITAGSQLVVEYIGP